METKHYGKVRGGANTVARLHLHIEAPDFSREEYAAVFAAWDEEFAMESSNWCGQYYPINSRREFAIVPAMIRKAERIGYRILVSMWDEGIKGKVALQDDPATFWQVVAMAQAFYRE